MPLALPEETAFLVITEADGDSVEAADHLRDQLLDVVGPGSLMVQAMEDPGLVSEFWRWRGNVPYAAAKLHGGTMGEDIAVPVEALERGLELLDRLALEFGLRACSWGHAGDGNMHATFLLNNESAAELERGRLASEALFAGVLQMRGTVSGEHGLGWIKRDQFDKQFAPAEAELQRAIKAVFDPAGLFNPGKKIPVLPVPLPG